MKDQGFEMVRYNMHGEVIGKPPKLWTRVYWVIIYILLLPVILSLIPSVIGAVTQDDIER